MCLKTAKAEICCLVDTASVLQAASEAWRGSLYAAGDSHLIEQCGETIRLFGDAIGHLENVKLGTRVGRSRSVVMGGEALRNNARGTNLNNGLNKTIDIGHIQ